MLADHSHEKDRRVLHALGYAQELRRTMSGFSNFAISFTIISILSGTLTLYYQGLNNRAATSTRTSRLRP
jgi:hypothetical protein